MRKLIFSLSIVLFTGLTHSQSKTAATYYIPPLDIPMILSGSFGELRSNHFHAGLDIKTQQREGLPVYAAADGYVERIKVGFSKEIGLGANVTQLNIAYSLCLSHVLRPLRSSSY